MSLDRIADALGKIDYPGAPDDVDRADRLLEAAALLDTGVVIDVDDLLFEDQVNRWHELTQVLPAAGWKPLIIWVAGECSPVWAPQAATRDDVDACRAPHLVIDWGQDAGALCLYPAASPVNDAPDATRFATVEALLEHLRSNPWRSNADTRR